MSSTKSVSNVEEMKENKKYVSILRDDKNANMREKSRENMVTAFRKYARFVRAVGFHAGLGYNVCGTAGGCVPR